MKITTDKKKTIILLLAAALIVAAAFLLFYQKGAFLGADINWQEGDFAFEEGAVKVQNRSAVVYFKGAEVWRTKWNVNVQQCVVSDIDRDGHDELMLLVWKRGSYGPHMPFWEKKNDNNLAQHIFIYKWEPKRTSKIRAIWMSSALSDKYYSMSSDNLGRIFITENDGELSAWYWENFGLKMLADNCAQASYIALGDQLLHLPVLKKGLKSGDYSYMYENISESVKSYDFATLNQETVYVEDRGLISDYPRFGSPAEVADAVAALGIDAVSLANNHALDKEMYGIGCSIKTNEENDIKVLGAHRKSEDATDPGTAVTFTEVNGIKLALLSFTYGLNGNPEPKEQPYAVELLGNEDRLIAALDYARKEAECVIVNAHWGTEYSPETDDEQRKYTEIFLEHGVDVVIGSHPHVIQPMNFIHGQNHDMLVYYSLGNLISNQKEEERRRGAAATFKIIRFPNGRITIADAGMKYLKTEGDTVLWDDDNE